MIASRRQALFALLLTAALAAIYLWVWILFPQMTAGAAGNDLLFIADGARRIAAGQIPHVDFSLPTGPLAYLLYYLAETWLPSIPAFIGMHFLFFALLSPLLIAACAQLPNRFAAATLVALAVVASLLPFNTTLGDLCGNAFYASYNRFGAALTLVYLAWFFRASEAPVWRNALILSCVAITAFFLKFVYLGLIIGPAVIYAVFDSRWRKAALIALAIVAGALVAVQFGSGIVSGYLDDMRAMSAVNSARVPYFLASFVFKSFFPLVLLGAFILVTVWPALQKFHKAGETIWNRLRRLAQPAAMAAALAGIVIGESQSTGGLEVVGALGLLFAPGVFAGPAVSLGTILAVAAAALIGGNFVANAFEKGMCGFLNRQGEPVQEQWAQTFVPHIVVPQGMADRAIARVALWTQGDEITRKLERAGHSLVDTSDSELYLAQWKTVDDAITELERRGLNNLGAVTTLAFVDMFGIALDAPPPKGVKIVLDVGRTVSPMSESEARAYLANVDTVFAPACGLVQTPGNDSAARWFAPVLAVDFDAQLLTPCWTMHRRKVR